MEGYVYATSITPGLWAASGHRSGPGAKLAATGCSPRPASVESTRKLRDRCGRLQPDCNTRHLAFAKPTTLLGRSCDFPDTISTHDSGLAAGMNAFTLHTVANRPQSTAFRGIAALEVLLKARRSLGITQIATALHLPNRARTISSLDYASWVLSSSMSTRGATRSVQRFSSSCICVRRNTGRTTH